MGNVSGCEKCQLRDRRHPTLRDATSPDLWCLLLAALALCREKAPQQQRHCVCQHFVAIALCELARDRG